MGEGDVSREALEAELRRSEARFRALAENSQDLISIVGLDGTLQYVSPASEKLLGYKPEELVGTAFNAIFPADVEVARAMYEGAIAGHPASPITIRVLRRGGEPVWIETLASLVEDPASGAPHIQTVSRDVTARKRAEDEAIRYAQMRDQFLAVLSHELRTPINAVMGFASMIEEEADALHQGFARKILAASDALLHMVEDLLDMSRLQSGKFKLDPEAMEIEEVLVATVESHQPQARVKGVALTLDLAGHLPRLYADPHRLTQVAGNLVGNALKFTPTGGSVVVRARLDGPSIRCEVVDTGVGIAPEDMPRLFAPFTQLDMGHTRRHGGAGLGLSICKGLIEAHGGRIGVTATPGGGSTFWFTLPLPADG